MQSSKPQPRPVRAPKSVQVCDDTETQRHRHHVGHHFHLPRHNASASAFGDLLSPGKTGAGTTGSPARQGPEAPGKDQETGQSQVDEAAAKEIDRSTDPSWREVRKLRAKRLHDEQQVREDLNSLSSMITSTTRQLDYTYYNLQAAIPAMSSSLSSLRDLSRSASELLSKFKQSDVPALVQEHEEQITGLQSTYDRIEKERIAGLEMRMRNAREKVKTLDERVAFLSREIDVCEIMEREAEKRSRRRLGWGLVGLALSFTIILLSMRAWSESDRGPRQMGQLLNGTEGFVRTAGTSLRRQEQISRQQSGQAEAVYQERLDEPARVQEDDPLARLFEEL